jgi:leucyl-tRNA synthetase
MEYPFKRIERQWQQWWKDHKVYEVPNESTKPKCYVLDMFPYPSGTGLHVGHPLGYIASDIYARYKRLQGFNVLHPMGFDAFGLPAEQYALETGQHPRVTTRDNIAAFKRQMDNIGFCFDWSREVVTSDPEYYRWTQWIFLKLFTSWYNRSLSRAEPIEKLIRIFEEKGNEDQPCPGDPSIQFSAAQWAAYSERQQQDILMHYRLAFSSYGEVNWCEALGTVLANDEVVNGLSERGGYPVVKKKLRQWYLRITEYADRLLQGLDQVDFSEAMKEMQSNWIGKSQGAEISFAIQDSAQAIQVYTTRPDTIFGVDFMVLAPEHELVEQITTPDQAAAVKKYVDYVKSRSERERMAEKKVSGCFTGAYAVHPFTGKPIPVWTSEYVLSGYGTGAIMAVPCGDERDHKFARHFDIPITNIIGEWYNGEEANPTKDAILQHSDFLNGMVMRDAIARVIDVLEKKGLGFRRTQYKMRDAAFSRQRYWGEPFPIRWENGIAVALDESALPLELPHVEKYEPGPEGQGPLANISEWTAHHYETNTMPGYAGSSWYFLRYTDPHNRQAFASREAIDYWNQVDVYIGGNEHAVGHLLYSRMWTKLLYDLGYIGFEEPYRRLINQGMVTGKSFFAEANLFSVGKDGKRILFLSSLRPDKHTDEVSVWEGREVLREAPAFSLRLKLAHKYLDAQGRLTQKAYGRYVREHPESFADWGEPQVIWENEAVTESGDPFLEGMMVEKMSKSKFNVENPDEVVENYGADTFRMYEMFLGPIEQSKPWDTQGIEGVHRFLKKLWRLFYDESGQWLVNGEAPTAEEWRTLHKTIKKVEEDTGRFSFNTAVSQFMICVNELTACQCHKREILKPLVILLTPYAPHLSEELWHALGETTTVLDAAFPQFDANYLKESHINYPVAINGKTRTEITVAADLVQGDLEKEVLSNAVVRKWIEGKTIKKVIVVKGRMVNVVI